MGQKLLIIDDELSIIHLIKRFFEKKKFEVSSAQTGKDGLKVFKKSGFDVILLDLNLPDSNGEEIAREIRNMDRDVAIIIITAHGSIQSSIKLFKLGIDDYVLKPFEIDALYFTVKKILDNKKIEKENIKLKSNLVHAFKPDNIIGKSKKMEDVYKLLLQVAPYDVGVLIQGESGTGKEVVAKTIHFSSKRGDKPFYAINCGAIPTELLESELFGYKKGSFTGAVNDKAGLFEEASQSTIFLDEINELPLKLQPKLLRVLQEKKIKRIGDNREVDLDMRIIAASSKDLKADVKAKKFRQDLFYRLNVFKIDLPPLRDRVEDIPLLINHFISKYKKEIKKEVKGISKEALDRCMRYRWPGNVRELENMIQRALVVANTSHLNTDDIIIDEETEVEGDITDSFNKMSYKQALDSYMNKIDKFYIQKALKETNYNKLKSADRLEISPRTLHYKIKKLFPEMKKI